MTIDELLEKVRYASDTSVTGQLAAVVRRLRAENAFLVEALEYWDTIIPLTEKNESAKDKNRAAIASYREARK